eukprot:TRINITY_DN1020_c0_g1_i2.p1 TRINITY_DN1020_c0_g1~~TRINITY_DN1020_c0_g1_i2.p1  ORF type:complete len:339 (+),score=63.87 TRINITY_DN1020_c0_g1_i2:103-1119(+)
MLRQHMMEENKQPSSSDALTPTVDDEFKKLRAEIEGLTSIIKPEDLPATDLPEVSTMDASFAATEFSHRPSRFQPNTSQAEFFAAQIEGKQQSEINAFLMQWVKRLIDEKSKSDRLLGKLREKCAAKAAQDQRFKKSHEELKAKAGLLEKRVVDLEKLLKESEIARKTLVDLAIQGKIGNQVSALPALEADEESEIMLQLNDAVRQKEEIAELTKKLQTSNAKYMELNEKYLLEAEMIKEFKEKAKKTMLTFKDQFVEHIEKLRENITDKLTNVERRLGNIIELNNKEKFFLSKKYKGKLLMYITALKDITKEMKRLQEMVMKVGKFKWELMPFYRIF